MKFGWRTRLDESPRCRVPTRFLKRKRRGRLVDLFFEIFAYITWKLKIERMERSLRDLRLFIRFYSSKFITIR